MQPVLPADADRLRLNDLAALLSVRESVFVDIAIFFASLFCLQNFFLGERESSLQLQRLSLHVGEAGFAVIGPIIAIFIFIVLVVVFPLVIELFEGLVGFFVV